MTKHTKRLELTKRCS